MDREAGPGIREPPGSRGGVPAAGGSIRVVGPEALPAGGLIARAAERISHHQPMERGWSLRCEAVAWVDTEWPGWIRVHLEDADGRAWYLVDKVPCSVSPSGQGPACR
jgi:hypothetical protein